MSERQHGHGDIGCAVMIIMIWLLALTVFATRAIIRIEHKLGLKPLTFTELYWGN